MKLDGFDLNKKLFDVNYPPQNKFSAVGYWLELDTSEYCNEQQISFYQNLIWLLWWIVELGQIYIPF